MNKELKDFEKAIIGQALIEIKTKKDIAVVIGKVKSTAVGLNKKAIKIFLELIESKKRAGLIK